MKEKRTTAFLIFISIAVCVSIALSVVTLAGQTKAMKKIEEIQGFGEDVNLEDGVVIAGEYEIKSTLPISEAYKTGDKSALSDFEKETLDMATDVLDGIIEDGMSDFEKEKAVYDYLTKNLTNDTGILTVISNNDDGGDNPHDVLKYHNAVCVGYATTFRMFMQMLDIECKVIHSSDLIHSWNLVKLDDGWYHTDCYMDNGMNTYHNFNMNDERCSQDHDWTREYFPEAKGKKYNYVFSVCETLDDIYSVPSWLVEAIDNGESLKSCTFKEEINSENENAAQYMVDQLVSQLDGDCAINYDWMLNEKSQYVLCFYIDYVNDENIPAELDDETAAEIDNAIAEALGIDTSEFDDMNDEFVDEVDY
ncbi:MAG: hypothetical protein E7515_04600 [Ruminococcaceae bacterium]|jgi:hypothetical protein|nr:hypothetical protein [Oscillospiraceae bacterium]